MIEIGKGNAAAHVLLAIEAQDRLVVSMSWIRIRQVVTIVRESAKIDIQEGIGATIEAGIGIEELRDGMEDVMTMIDIIEGRGTRIETPLRIEIVEVEEIVMGSEVDQRTEREAQVRRRRKRSRPRI